MPEWIHNRAEHLLSKNPSMPKHMAFAIATQQAHATGKSPKGYGTAEGRRTAKSKFTTPKDDVKKANPGSLETPKLKHASIGTSLVTIMRKVAGAGVGTGFSTSQYSGPLSYGGFKQTSGIPSFTAPSPTKVDQSLEAKTAALTSPTGAMSAGAKLHASQSIGAPKVSAPPGPSIAEVSKPKGFGKPLSGALKNRL